MNNQRFKDSSIIRNFVFGVEDSLVSTVGLLSGIAVAGIDRSDIVVTGVVLIFVEAFSMGIGSFLSERSAEEYVLRRETTLKRPSKSGLTMFISYLLAGFVPLSPYFFLIGNSALLVSVSLSLVALFLLGFVSGRFSGISVVKDGLRMLVLGGLAIVIGILVGQLLR